MTSKSGDNGLGYFASCDCADFAFRSRREQAMTQAEINVRWDRARDKLYISVSHADGDLWDGQISGGSETHNVWVSKGEGDAGPNFLCAHCLCALRLILKQAESFDVLAFGCPDTWLPPFWQFETISIDGWMVALKEKRK